MTMTSRPTNAKAIKEIEQRLAELERLRQRLAHINGS